jgi:hypothetical protein
LIGEAAMMMIDMHTASGLRRWAMQCAASANDPRASGNERDRLLLMRKALLDLADAQDWLDGRAGSSRSAQVIRKTFRTRA